MEMRETSCGRLMQGKGMAGWGFVAEDKGQ
jgi:hypothetical protein